MGLKLVLAGRHVGEQDDGWLRQVEAWLDANAAETLRSQRFDSDPMGPVLRVRLHPAAEEVAICAAGKSRVVISANTSTVGPGYHRYLCGLLRQLAAALQITWAPAQLDAGVGDPTGYFETQDAAELEAQMLRWLSSAARDALILRQKGLQGIPLSMHAGHHFDHQGALLTPLGPRDEAWLTAVQDDPRRGVDVFPWWSAGIGAEYRLGRALNHLWTEVVWRPPLLDEERRLFRDVTHLLECAWRENPSLSYPWHEWRELLAYLGIGGTLAEEVSRRASAVEPREQIGYRRGLVQVTLPGGWTIRIPGSLIEAHMADGAWVARDHRRTIRFVDLEGDHGPAGLPEGIALAERLEHKGQRVTSEAAVQRAGEGGTLTGLFQTAGRRALCVVEFQDADDLEWAKQTWRSVDAIARA